MQLRNGIQTLDAYRPTFNPHLDIATEVFSHVQCVKTRDNLARVSKLWRDASKEVGSGTLTAEDRSMLSLCEIQAEAVVGIMNMASDHGVNMARQLPYHHAIMVELERKSQGDTFVKVLAREIFLRTVAERELHLKTVAAKMVETDAKVEKRAAKKKKRAANEKKRRAEFFEANGCEPCHYAATYELWDCLQYSVDNKCPGWEYYAEKYAEHLR